jgi:hypothetical protein
MNMDKDYGDNAEPRRHHVTVSSVDPPVETTITTIVPAGPPARSHILTPREEPPGEGAPSPVHSIPVTFPVADRKQP